MARTPEGVVKDDIKDWLDARGFQRAGAAPVEGELRGWYYMPVNNGMGVSGIPDFMGSGIRLPDYTPFPWAIEAKKPGGVPTPRQLDRHAEMQRAGWLVLVVDDVSQLSRLENYIQNGT